MGKDPSKPKYEIGDKVKTSYGTGKVIARRDLISEYSVTYCYKIRYSLFRRLWCFEFTIEGKCENES